MKFTAEAEVRSMVEVCYDCSSQFMENRVDDGVELREAGGDKEPSVRYVAIEQKIIFYGVCFPFSPLLRI